MNRNNTGQGLIIKISSPGHLTFPYGNISSKVYLIYNVLKKKTNRQRSSLGAQLDTEAKSGTIVHCPSKSHFFDNYLSKNSFSELYFILGLYCLTTTFISGSCA